MPCYLSKDLHYEKGMVTGLIGPLNFVFSRIVLIEGIYFLQDRITMFIELKVIIKDYLKKQWLWACRINPRKYYDYQVRQRHGTLRDF